MTRWTETEMIEALWRHWSIYYACITQCPSADTIAGAVPHRRIDMLLIGRTVPERVAVEIKVTQGDFRSEIRNPAKRSAWDPLTHRFIFAVPAGLGVDPDDVPEGCGLVTVSRTEGDPEHPYYQVQEVTPGATRDPGPTPDWLLPYLAGRLDTAETLLAGRGVDALHRLPRGALVRRLRQTDAALQRVRARPATR